MPKKASLPKKIDAVEERLLSAAVEVFLDKGF
jgi:hypothetical protein